MHRGGGLKNLRIYFIIHTGIVSPTFADEIISISNSGFPLNPAFPEIARWHLSLRQSPTAGCGTYDGSTSPVSSSVSLIGDIDATEATTALPENSSDASTLVYAMSYMKWSMLFLCPSCTCACECLSMCVSSKPSLSCC